MGYFVQDNGDGTYSLVDTGDTQDTSQWRAVSTGEKTAMERAYNTQVGLPNAPQPSTLPFNLSSLMGGLLPQLNAAPYMLEQIRSNEAIALAQQQYLRDRLNMLELPEMQQSNALQRHNLAIQLAVQRAGLTGRWIEPASLDAAVAPMRNIVDGGGAVGYTAADIANIRQQLASAGWPGGSDEAAIRDFIKTVEPGSQQDLVARLQGGPAAAAGAGGAPSYSAADIQNVRAQLKSAGWPGGSDEAAIRDFLNVVETENDPAQQALVARLTGQGVLANPPAPPLPVGGAPVGPGRGVPTIAGANLIANPQPFSDVVGMLGSPVAKWLARKAQGAAGTEPTLELQELMGNPRNLVQSLVLAGLNPSQITKSLEGSQFVQGLYGGQGLPPLSQKGFQFIPGQKLPVQETLRNLRTNSQVIPLIQGLMSYAGMNPVEEFGKFLEGLPSGGPVPQTRYI